MHSEIDSLSPPSTTDVTDDYTDEPLCRHLKIIVNRARRDNVLSQGGHVIDFCLLYELPGDKGKHVVIWRLYILVM